MEAILQEVSKEQLEQLCHQYNLPINTSSESKSDLLQKLRRYAQVQAQLDQQRNLERLERAREEGIDVSEISQTDVEGVFFYQAPVVPDTKKQKQKEKQKEEGKVWKESLDEQSYKEMSVSPTPSTTSRNNEDEDDLKQIEEKVVTIFNSRDTNDLTGFNPSSIPGQEISNAGSILGSMEGGGSATTTAFLQNNKNPQKKNLPLSQQDQDFDLAEEKCIQLIQTLLVKTGLVGFYMEMEDDEDEDDEDLTMSIPKTYSPFDPSTVSLSLLQQYTPSLLSHEGKALRSALDQVELNAIGQDGMSADDITKNGGHYREARKVGVFLEGYRVAEVRRKHREMTSELLEALVSGGIRELDRRMNTMVQAGVIEDSLVLYLTDLVRKQEQKVQQLQSSSSSSSSKLEPTAKNSKSYSSEGKLLDTQTELEQVNDVLIEWNQTKDSNGQIIEETIDPNNPEIQAVLQRTSTDTTTPTKSEPTTAPEKILLLLRLLRERVKAEAAFFKGSGGTDHHEHGMNLRLLAYCLYANSDQERYQILSETFGTTSSSSSMDKLDSFLELIQTSIDYTESTSFQLSPGSAPGNGALNGAKLNPKVLSKILVMVEEMKEMLSFQAAGGSIVPPSSSLENNLGGGGDLSAWQ